MSEQRKAYKKAWYQANKEAISEQKKAYYQANKEQNKAYKEANKEAIAERQKVYNQTPAGKKVRTISDWKRSGMIGDLSFIYDEYYLNCERCWVCGHDFSVSWKCCDHDHEITDKENFRQILCHKCNVMDAWKNHS